MERDIKPLVIVLSRSYSTGLGVIRSLGEAGYEVDLIANSYRQGEAIVAMKSKYLRKCVEVVSKKVKDGRDKALLSELFKYEEESKERKIVLFPTDDYTTSVVDLNRSNLDKFFILPSIVGGGNGSVTERMDKTVQGQLAKAAGLQTPLEWIFSLEEEIVIPEDMVYPCFCKPLESVTGYKKEMAVCNHKEELKDHLEKLQRKFSKRSILVQEFLNIEQEIDLSGVCLDQEIIIPAIIKKTRVAQHERGVTLAGKIVPFEEIEEIKENIIHMLKTFHYVGMFDMELNVVGDKIYFNEVNLRSGGPHYSYFASGVNLPALFVKEALGKGHSFEETRVVEYGKTFVYEKVAWEDYIFGYMTQKELNACLSEADIMLLNNDADPEPGKVFLRKIRMTALKNHLRNLKKNVKSGIKNRIRSIVDKVSPYILRLPQTKKENQRDPNAERPRVIVAGRNYSSNLCMARSLGKAGYEVEVVRVFTKRPKTTDIMKQLKPDAYSKYVKAYHVCITNRKNRRIVDMLKELADPNRKLLLIPNDDLVASTVDTNLDELKEFFLIPNVNGVQGEIDRLMSKSVQKEIASAAGLPVLNSCVIRTEKGNFEIPETVTYPCFIKPNISKNSSKSRIRKCENEAELKSALKEFSAKKDIEMLVEDYIEIAKEYSLLGLSTKDGTVGPGIFIVEEGGHAERKGVTMSGRILPCAQMQPLVSDLNRFVDSLGYEGLFDVDLIETTEGKVYFVELNLRYGASGYAVTESGVNLPGMYADYMLLQKAIDLNCKVEDGKVFISEKIMIDEYIGDFLAKTDLKRMMESVDIHFIMDVHDPQPYRHFKRFYSFAAFKRMKRKLKETCLSWKTEGKEKIIPVLLGYPQVKKKNRRNPESEKVRVLIAGRNYCSNLCLARSFGEAGYEVEVLRIFQTMPKRSNLMRFLRPEAYSKYVKAFYICVSRRKAQKIVDFLKQLSDPNRKMLLIPADDLVASIVDENYEELRELYLLPNVNHQSGELNRLMNKGVQKELARDADLPVLNSCVITAEKGVFEIPDSVTYPCFVKPNVSKNSSKSNMRQCATEGELAIALLELSERKAIEVVVEDYVEIEREYSILGLSTKDGVVGPGFFGALEGGHNERRGVAMTGQILPCSEQQELLDKINRFVGTLNYEGLFDVDLIETKDGKLYFVELNLRYGASGYAVTQSGANLPGVFADYMIFDKPIDLTCKVEAGKTFISEKVMLEEYMNSFLSWSDLKKQMNSVDVHFVMNEQDKGPYKHFRLFYLFAMFKKMYLKMK